MASAVGDLWVLRSASISVPASRVAILSERVALGFAWITASLSLGDCDNSELVESVTFRRLMYSAKVTRLGGRTYWPPPLSMTMNSSI